MDQHAQELPVHRRLLPAPPLLPFNSLLPPLTVAGSLLLLPGPVLGKSLGAREAVVDGEQVADKEVDLFGADEGVVLGPFEGEIEVLDLCGIDWFLEQVEQLVGEFLVGPFGGLVVVERLAGSVVDGPAFDVLQGGGLLVEPLLDGHAHEFEDDQLKQAFLLGVVQQDLKHLVQQPQVRKV